MPMWTCDFAACQRPAVRTLGECALCNRHLCSSHLQHPFHNCPKWEDADAYDPASQSAEAVELELLIRKINTSALAFRASELRGGIPCSVPPLRYDRSARSSVMGGMNYHIEVTFQDGVKWLARVRRSNATSPPPELRDYIVHSEIATLKFLEQTTVPAPKVFDFALENTPDNAIGVGYILMEKLPGSSLRWATATDAQRARVMEQLAGIFVELHKHPFDLLGSLDRLASSHIGPFARESLADFAANGEMRAMGPFSSLEDYHRSELSLILDLIIRGELYSQRPVDAYLIHRFLVDLTPQICSLSVRDQDGAHFYLRHADDKGDHILVDEDFNITGIIDWEWAYTAPPSRAFNSPVAFLPVAAFYRGENGLSEDELVFARLLEEKGREDLASFVRDGRIQHRFAFCCGYDLEDWEGFIGLFQGLRDVVEVDRYMGWHDWKMAALHRYRKDAGLLRLMAGDETLS
ncbi:hypothetical protein F5Y18DRAFT_408348 [Xylariaceae sp. FL1019]|nr:hypothetical protein F5Y18DRAFT_408348 [Xylariaceae sp. FL1019]